MRIRCVTGLIMLLVLSLASCREGRWWTFGLSAEEDEMLRLDLSLADSLMEESPDSSMSILRRDSALACHAGMEYRMMYNLLRTQADDKLYVTHKSDSVIREAAEYFSVNGNARQQAQAWYLLGRVSYDLHHASTAMSTFRHVLSVKDESSVVCRYKSRSFAWLGTIYEKDKMYKNLLACSRQAYHYAERSDYASDLMAYALRDIGRSFSYLKDNEKAISYYKKALKTARQATDNELFKTIENELSAIYIEEGQLHNAEKILLRPMKWTSNEDLAPYYYTTGKYYETKGDIDSAVFYYKKNIAIASMYSKTLTAAHLVDLYDKYGNHVEARKYRELGKIYEDSLGLQKQIETQDNDKIVEKEMRTQNQNDELIHARRVLIAVFCLLGTVLIVIPFLVFFKYRKNKKQLSYENKRIMGYWGKIHKQDINKIKETQAQISQLQDDLSQKMRQTVKNEVSVSQSPIRSKNKNLDIIKELGKSKIYTSFANAMYQPSQQDFIQLENILNSVYGEFTERLKLHCPKLNKDELRLCCLLKIGVPGKTIGIYLRRSSSSLSMMRKRLYKKFFDKAGKPADLDAFIKEF